MNCLPVLDMIHNLVLLMATAYVFDLITAGRPRKNDNPYPGGFQKIITVQRGEGKQDHPEPKDF